MQSIPLPNNSELNTDNTKHMCYDDIKEGTLFAKFQKVLQRDFIKAYLLRMVGILKITSGNVKRTKCN